MEESSNQEIKDSDYYAQQILKTFSDINNEDKPSNKDSQIIGILSKMKANNIVFQNDEGFRIFSEFLEIFSLIVELYEEKTEEIFHLLIETGAKPYSLNHVKGSLDTYSEYYLSYPDDNYLILKFLLRHSSLEILEDFRKDLQNSIKECQSRKVLIKDGFFIEDDGGEVEYDEIHDHLIVRPEEKGEMIHYSNVLLEVNRFLQKRSHREMEEDDDTETDDEPPIKRTRPEDPSNTVVGPKTEVVSNSISR